MANSRRASITKRGKSWVVKWRDLDGRQREKAVGPIKTAAKAFAAKITGELVEGICGGIRPIEWDRFVDEFDTLQSAEVKSSSLAEYKRALSHFKRICKPRLTSDVSDKMINAYKAKRLAEPARNGNTVSKASINKELRGLKRAFRLAAKWDMLRKAPEIELFRIPKVAPTFVSLDEFQLLYANCNAAEKPDGLQNATPKAWWQAFLTFQFLTGWRISEALALRWEDVSLEDGYAITRAADNKAGSEERIPLHPLIVGQLRLIQGFSSKVFPLTMDRRGMDFEFERIQKAAGVARTCRKDHQHAESCKTYSFHDLRRGFATANASRLSAVQLKAIMRHASFSTTLRYINQAKQVGEEVTSKMAVPNIAGIGEAS